MALLSGGLAIALGGYFSHHWPLKLPFITLYTAIIMASAWFGGFGPGLVCTACCAAAVAYYWMDPPNSFAVGDPGEMSAIVMFVGIGAVISMLSEALHRARRREERARMQREEILAIVSHELRNPLSVISTGAALMEKAAVQGEGGDAQRRRVAAVRRSVQQMDHILADLLDWATIEAGQLSIQAAPQTPEEVRSLVRQLREVHASAAEAKSITLELDRIEVDGEMRYDRDRMLQVLSNLIGNALKFTPKGGRIAVHVEPRDGGARFSVTDTGPGIPEDKRARIFERYWHEDRTRGGGTGLGLYISRAIVAAHGGQLAVESEPGRGSSFFFTLPCSGQGAMVRS